MMRLIYCNKLNNCIITHHWAEGARLAGLARVSRKSCAGGKGGGSGRRRGEGGAGDHHCQSAENGRDNKFSAFMLSRKQGDGGLVPAVKARHDGACSERGRAGRRRRSGRALEDVASARAVAARSACCGCVARSGEETRQGCAVASDRRAGGAHSGRRACNLRTLSSRLSRQRLSLAL